MNISAGQFNSLRYKSQSTKKLNGSNSTPFKKDLNFGANITQKINKKTAMVVFENANEMISRIDDTLGKGYFSNILGEAENIKHEGDKLIYKNRTIGQDLLKTAEAIIDIPIRLADATAKKLNVKYKPDGFMDKWVKRKSHQKAFDKALDIIEEFIRPTVDLTDKQPFFKRASDFIKRPDRVDELEINTELCDKVFRNNASSNITKVKKDYESRDERALNRIVTATVSSLYAANDFYNISMLQKDDDKEAKKAHNKKLKQELRRMASSASLTFISLGALDRYTKKSVFWNAIVIAASTLISEVCSRLKSGYSLVPLTPEQAAKRAQKEAQKNANKKQETKNNKVSFKSNLKDEKEIYKNFVQKDGSLIAFNQVAKNTEENNNTVTKKKKTSILGIIAGLSAIASVAYLISRALKGGFTYDKKKVEFFEKHKDEILKREVLSKETVDELLEYSEKYGKDKFAPFDGIKKIITKKQVTVKKDDLNNKITELIEYARKNGRSDVADILDNYLPQINEAFGDEAEITAKIEKPIATGIYKGVTKIFDTLYTVLSAPAVGLCKLLNIKNNKACKTFDKLLEQNNADYNKELAILSNVCSKAKNNDEILDIIAKRVRNVEIGAETSDLANISRTMVTILTTYFFVNDYRNEVLIESGGKDVEGAQEEMKERLYHKVSNFIINGTLMNTFNTIFINPLNKKLFNAAVIAGATETINEFLVRKSICQPILKKRSKQEIINYEEKQLEKGGFMGWWSRTFRKLTGKKTLTQKAGINSNKK